MTTALVLILLSAVVHAVVNVLTKRAEDKYAMRLLIGVFSAVLVTPALFFVPLPHGIAIWFLFGTAFVHSIYELLLVKSYESAAFSAVYPVARGTGPLFTALGAIFLLHEHAPLIELAGILFVCGGVIAIGLSHRATEGATTGLSYALGTGLTIGCYTLIDASGVRAVDQPFTYVLWFFVAHGASVMLDRARHSRQGRRASRRAGNGSSASAWRRFPSSPTARRCSPTASARRRSSRRCARPASSSARRSP